MPKTRAIYFTLFILTIVVGLLSRHFGFIPLFIGDVLWALMVYFMMRFVFVNATITRVTAYSLFFCYAIEFSQLYKAPWIDNLRHTLFGKLVLGDTFLWGDLLSYTIGIAIGIIIDKWMRVLKT